MVTAIFINMGTNKLIKLKDIKSLNGSIWIQSIKNKKIIERLYFELPDEICAMGHSIDVFDYDYLGFLVIGHKSNNVNKLIDDLIICLNKLL